MIARLDTVNLMEPVPENAMKIQTAMRPPAALATATTTAALILNAAKTGIASLGRPAKMELVALSALRTNNVPRASFARTAYANPAATSTKTVLTNHAASASITSATILNVATTQNASPESVLRMELAAKSAR